MIPREILKKIRQIELRTRRLVNESLAGHYHSVFKGQGMNFDEVREYQPGDEVRTIDWNVTARMNHPFVKKYVEERELTVILMVDLSGSGLFGSVSQSKRELAAEIASVLAFSAIRNNDKVGLSAGGSTSQGQQTTAILNNGSAKTIRISGTPGQTFKLYTSSNLTAWTEVSTVTLSGSSFDYTDDSSGAKFYKAVPQ